MYKVAISNKIDEFNNESQEDINNNNNTENLPDSHKNKEPIIFKNMFTLQFAKDSIQTKFDSEFYKFTKSELLFFIITIIIYVVGYSAYLVYEESIVIISLKKQNFIYNIVELILIGSSIFMYTLKIIYKQNLTIAKVYKYFFLACFSGSMIALNSIIDSFFKEDSLSDYYFYFYFTQFVLKIIYMVAIDCEFLRIFIVKLTFISMAWITSALSITEEPLIIMKSARLTVAFSILIVISYFYDKFYRKLFYLSSKVETQKNFYLNTLNNMQNGIFVYNNHKQKVKFINNYLKRFDEFKKKISNLSDPYMRNNNILTNEVTADTNQDKLENYNIFNFVIETNKNLPKEVIDFMRLDHFTESVDNIIKYFEENQDTFQLKKSMYIGNIKLKENGNENLFELYIRNIQVDDDSYMEFMLNNVTYTQIQELEKTKQKTQILARITHEFKNPLVVSSEVIEEISDDLSVSEVTRQNLKFLKNLSLYMLVLVKDFEVISNIENKVDNTKYPVNINLREFKSEIQEFVEALIKKKNSIHPLNFIVNIDRGLNYFRTDIMRLKQILINLISNSIKFTEVGYIELKIEILSNEPEYISDNIINNQSEKLKNIKISVIDTGKGIPIEKQNDLFNSVIKENSDANMLGTGYGLGIVKNLCKMLGSDIRYTENKPRGSIFYFILPESNNTDNLDKNIDKNNNINNNLLCSLKDLNKLNANSQIDNNSIDKELKNVCIIETIKNLNIYTDSIKEFKTSQKLLPLMISNDSKKTSSGLSSISQSNIETPRKIFTFAALPSSFFQTTSNNLENNDVKESKISLIIKYFR